MGLLERIKAKAQKKVEVVTRQYFESEQEPEEAVGGIAENPSELTIPQEVVEEEIQQMANEILQEAVAELNQSNDTIYAVKDCIETMGQDAEAGIITKMVIKVAKKDPEVLRRDGQTRIELIEKVVKDIKASSQKAIEEATEREKQIRETENKSESSYTFDVSELNRQCEEEIMQLRLKLQENIEAREKQRDEELGNCRQQREKSKAETNKIEALTRAVTEYATKQQAEIKLYLSKLQVEA